MNCNCHGGPNCCMKRGFASFAPYPYPTAPMPQGWVCPKCDAVMSPSMVCCVRCTGEHNTGKEPRDG